MKKTIQINNQPLTYTLTKSRRAKNIRVSVDPHGQIKLTLPWYVPQIMGKRFLQNNAAWIQKTLSDVESRPKPKTYSKQELTEMKIKTRNLVRDRIQHFNAFYQLEYHRLTIRNQKTRWGSCSSNKTLSFNCKLCLLPPALIDYVVVHEICHLKHMDHSVKFWSLVERQIPNHRSLRRQLRRLSTSL